MMKQKGFTLIELLVVVTIIGILAAAAIPKLMTAMDKAKVGRCKSDMATTRGAAQMYNMDKGAWPASTATMVTEYLPAVPKPPAGGTLTFTSGAGDAFTLTCGVKTNCNAYFENTVGEMKTEGTACP